MTKNNTQKKIACVIGTRPEAIKMMPIVHLLRQQAWAQLTVIASAQHRDMLDDMLSLFKIKVDIDLDTMRPNQTLSDVSARLTSELDAVIRKGEFDAVLAQGDTTTVLTTALVCFYHKIPFAHIEAGLRSHDRYNPFPEEMNRVLTAQLTTWQFAPTPVEKHNLLQEGVSDSSIYVVGNTSIDAVLWMAQQNFSAGITLDPNKRLILVTAHRRESFGASLENICTAIKTLADKFPDIEFVYPVHPNPNVQTVVNATLRGNSQIHLVPPLSYEKFVSLLKNCYFVMTDSGGIQEEAPALSKPVLILRDKTERTAVIDAGVAKLTGTDKANIVAAASQLLTNAAEYAAMKKGISPYGDGHSAEQIVSILYDKLCQQ